VCACCMLMHHVQRLVTLLDIHHAACMRAHLLRVRYGQSQLVPNQT
jgi:hypothetical protein